MCHWSRIHTMIGHMGEISSVHFNWDCLLIVSASMDKSCKVRIHYYIQDISWINASYVCMKGLNLACVFLMCVQVWDAESGQCLATLIGHDDEVLDVCFNYTGQLIATASADGENIATISTTTLSTSPPTTSSPVTSNKEAHHYWYLTSHLIIMMFYSLYSLHQHHYI